MLLVFEVGMEKVRISQKFRVVIPKCVRETFHLKAGEELEVCVVDGSIHFQRPPTIKSLRGAAKGMRWKEDDRDRSDRF
jgi:AbrB family looped-hinge helix DNA binding protein